MIFVRMFGLDQQSSSKGSTFFRISALPTPASSKGRATLSKTVREERRLKCWKIIPICLLSLRSSSSDIFVRSFPSTMTVPEVGLLRRLMHLTKVLFPAPLRADNSEDFSGLDADIDIFAGEKLILSRQQCHIPVLCAVVQSLSKFQIQRQASRSW